MGEHKQMKPWPDYLFPQDVVASAISAWWRREENQGFLPGTVSSSIELANYLRQLGLIRERTKCAQCDVVDDPTKWLGLCVIDRASGGCDLMTAPMEQNVHLLNHFSVVVCSVECANKWFQDTIRSRGL